MIQNSTSTRSPKGEKQLEIRQGVSERGRQCGNALWIQRAKILLGQVEPSLGCRRRKRETQAHAHMQV